MVPAAADARRNALVLAAAQAIIGSANPVALSVGGLADELKDEITKDPGNIVSIASRVIDARP